MIKKYIDLSEYEAAGLPTDESRVAQIESTNEIKVDGVNILVDIPELGDAVYYNGSEAVFFKGGSQLVTSKLPDNIKDNKIGVVVDIIDNYALIINKDNGGNLKYCDVLQYLLSAPTLDGEEHTLTIGLWLSNNSYASATTISFTYSTTALSEVVTALNAAIDAKKTEVSFNQTVWSYLADANNNKVDSDESATKIIIQIDTWNDYRQYLIQGGTFITWGDMPVSSNSGFRINGNTEGSKILSVSRAAAFFVTNGRVPTLMVLLNENAQIIKLESFNGEYGKILRDTYGTYEKYIATEYYIMYPQKLGVFGLPDGKTLTLKYGNMTAPTKDGGTKYKFPAMHYALTVGYNNIQGLEIGNWYLPGVNEAVVFMEDNNISIINSTASKIGMTQINNSSHRWFSQRHNAINAWIFYGGSGNLHYYAVYGGYVALAVALLKIKH